MNTTAEIIRAAYIELTTEDGEWVGLAQLREEIIGIERSALDAALQEMACTEGVHIAAEPNQKALSQADRDAAVTFGGDTRHMMMIEPAWED